MADLKELLKAVVADIRTFQEMEPEEDESWESWYEAAFDMLAERVKETFAAQQLLTDGKAGA